MAGTPKRAANVEAALIGKAWNEATIDAAQAAFDADYQPLTDWRATADYRQLAAKNLLMRFFMETSGETVQLQRFAGGRHDGQDRPSRTARPSPARCTPTLRHDSAHKHVAGSADYIDDMPEPAGTLHGALGMTDRAHAEILAMDLSAVEAAPGVVCVLTAKDMPAFQRHQPEPSR